MKIRTTRFGTINVSEGNIITMPFGMLGFLERKRFVILQHKTNSPLFWYQSVDDAALAFVITNPYFFEPEYSVNLDGIMKEMSWDEAEAAGHLELYVIVNIPKGAPHKMTANFIGPILINNTNRQAVQLVITDSPYSHKQSLIKKNQRSIAPIAGPTS